MILISAFLNFIWPVVSKTEDRLVGEFFRDFSCSGAPCLLKRRANELPKESASSASTSSCISDTTEGDDFFAPLQKKLFNSTTEVVDEVDAPWQV